ncbi:hypothetical protein [Undibacterium griseum]|uniref:Uncharacterized protein n=1 Tax=Undibacterium griseum TaxID=2762295 RepID=A0ABR6YP06_9BURK|nr:hypothetical protein [Undibacterium griseum]MBC3885642.1 hypothetical protein [Undibacterium griseum]
MQDILICFVSIMLVSGYWILVFFFVIEGCEKWWHPFVLAALFPIMLIYENWIGLVAVALFFSLLFGIPIAIGKASLWFSGAMS